MTPITDKIKQLPDGGIKRQTYCKDCGIPYGRHRSGLCHVTDFAHAWVTRVDLEAENARLASIAEDAVRLGREQAREWDRFWQAIGCGSEDISVDDAIAKYQSLISELETAKRALEQIRDWTGNDHAMRQIATDALSNEEPWI